MSLNPLWRVINKTKARIIPSSTVATANTPITADKALYGIRVSNIGATGAITFALPPATVGMSVVALVQAAQELRLDPSGTETIALPSTGVQGAAGKYLTADAIGERVKLICIVAGQWHVEHYIGTFTAEP